MFQKVSICMSLCTLLVYWWTRKCFYNLTYTRKGKKRQLLSKQRLVSCVHGIFLCCLYSHWMGLIDSTQKESYARHSATGLGMQNAFLCADDLKETFSLKLVFSRGSGCRKSDDEHTRHVWCPWIVIVAALDCLTSLFTPTFDETLTKELHPSSSIPSSIWKTLKTCQILRTSPQ